MTDRPFDDIRGLIQQASFPGRLTAPSAADLGDIGVAADWIAVWRGKARMVRPIFALYAGAHAGGPEIGDVADTRAFMETVATGEAVISRGAQSLGAGLDVYDLALDRPLPSAAAGPTMSERECAATMAFGMEVLAKQPDLLILVGLGPGADAAAEAVLAAVAAGGDPLEALRSQGGRETAAIAGAIVGARSQNIPVLLDGPAARAAAAVVAAVTPGAADHCRTPAQLGAPAIDRTDGTAALAALSLVKLACAMLEGAA